MATQTNRNADKYPNILTQTLTMSAANTFTTEEVDIGLSIFEKVGLLISRVDYHIASGTLLQMTASGDDIAVGFGTNGQATSIDVAAQSQIDSLTLKRMDFGTAGNGHVFETPFTKDFSMLPGGGLLITPRPWYIQMSSAGLASAGTCVFRFYFTVRKMADADYFELLETRHYFGS